MKEAIWVESPSNGRCTHTVERPALGVNQEGAWDMPALALLVLEEHTHSTKRFTSFY